MMKLQEASFLTHDVMLVAAEALPNRDILVTMPDFSQIVMSQASSWVAEGIPEETAREAKLVALAMLVYERCEGVTVPRNLAERRELVTPYLDVLRSMLCKSK